MNLEPAALVVGLLVSTIGLSVFLYGKKQTRLPHLVAGILLMLLPFVTPSPWLESGVAATLVGGLWLAVQRGW